MEGKSYRHFGSWDDSLRGVYNMKTSELLFLLFTRQSASLPGITPNEIADRVSAGRLYATRRPAKLFELGYVKRKAAESPTTGKPCFVYTGTTQKGVKFLNDLNAHQLLAERVKAAVLKLNPELIALMPQDIEQPTAPAPADNTTMRELAAYTSPEMGVKFAYDLDVGELQPLDSFLPGQYRIWECSSDEEAFNMCRVEPVEDTDEDTD